MRLSLLIILLCLVSTAILQQEDLVSSGEAELPDAQISTIQSFIDEAGEITDYTHDPLMNGTVTWSELNNRNLDENETIALDPIAKRTAIVSTNTSPLNDFGTAIFTSIAETFTTIVEITTEQTTTTTTTMETKAPTTIEITTVATTTTEKAATPARSTRRLPTTWHTTRSHTKKSTTTTKSPETTPEVSEAECTLLNESFSCTEEITCYGKGEIDCTEVFEIVGSESPDPATKIVVDPNPSDSLSDFDEVQTFPPELIGNAKPNKPAPYLFKIKPRVTGDMDFPTTATIREKAEFVLVPTTVLPGAGIEDAEAYTPLEEPVLEITTSAVTETDTTTVIPMDGLVSSAGEAAAETTVSETVMVISEEQSPAKTETSHYYTSTTAIPKTTENKPKLTSLPLTDDSEVARWPHEKRKRDAKDVFPSESSSAVFQSAALETKNQKNIINTCRIAGNLKCTPTPTLGMCKGKTFCKALVSKEDKSKSKSTAVGNWAVAIIAICAVAAGFTIILLIYLAVTSWKKLKVQPQSGVTTLTYVNNTSP